MPVIVLRNRRATRTLRRRPGPFALFLAAILGTVFIPPLFASAGDLPITLDDAVRLAIANNLALRAASFDPAVAESGARRAHGIYDVQLTSLLDFRGEDDKPTPVAPDAERKRFFDANVAAERLLPSGATASVAFTNLFSRDNLGMPTSHFAKPALSVSLSQPLLQGFGRDVTEKGIITARLSSDAAASDWRAKAQATVADARDGFFTLLAARSNLETRKISLETARRLHAQNEARVRAGLLASIELLDSAFGVAQRQKDLLDAEKAVRDAEDGLRVLLQIPAEEHLVPAEPGIPSEAAPGGQEAVAAALAHRPEIISARLALRTAEFNAQVAGNAVLPSLALTGSAGVSGLGSDYGRALDDLGSGKYPSWAAGLSFSFPIGNAAAREDLAASRLKARQARVSLRSLEESIGLEVRSALRDLETRKKQIDVAGKGLELAEARFASYLERARIGLATTKDTLQAESDRVAARNALVTARTDLQGALTRLWKSTGELLDRHGIRIGNEEIREMIEKETR
ncbi:MAG: TolC family protein [Deltaproteobacteria bacterium]|nr:TolC family protein [Deltaproteobacteria bacterium]